MSVFECLGWGFIGLGSDVVSFLPLIWTSYVLESGVGYGLSYDQAHKDLALLVDLILEF